MEGSFEALKLLRKVVISGNESETKKGYFHSWFKKVAENGDECIMALVELTDGSVIKVIGTDISFKLWEPDYRPL